MHTLTYLDDHPNRTLILVEKSLNLSVESSNNAFLWPLLKRRLA
jgi:hypothetical protein